MTLHGQPADRLSAVTDALRLFVQTDQVTELRALNVGMLRSTRSGFYDGRHLDLMARAALDIEAQASGVYFTLNPVDPQLLLRRPNRFELARDTVCDSDIIARRWLLIDADPVRPADCSATDDEKTAAWKLIQAVKAHLIEERDAPADALILADSGNGYHLLVHLPSLTNGVLSADEVKAALAGLADRFDTGAARIDRKVFNLARITKVYGTLTRKGENTPERPWRRSRLMEVPPRSEPCARGVLPLDALLDMVKAGQNVLARQAVKPAVADILPFTKPPAAPPADDRERLRRRAWADRRTWDIAVSGQNGHAVTLRQASRLINGYCLTFDEALDILRDWNKECVPPWDDRDLQRKLREAQKLGPGNGKPYGYLLMQEGVPVPAEPAPAAAPEPAGSPNGSDEPERPALENRACSRAVKEKPAEAGEQWENVPPPSGRPSLPDPVIYHGLAGDIVRALEKQTEADPLAILVQFLAMFGNHVGRGPYFRVEASRHYCNLFVTIVGKSGQGRKGVSKDRALEVFRLVDPEWCRDRPHGSFAEGIQSGEAVVELVRDNVVRHESRRNRETGERTVETVIDRPAFEDKRLVIQEEEFARLLGVIYRDGSTISPILRKAWDRGDLSILTKASSVTATNAHVSIVGHITPDELRGTLDSTEMANGFGNRFLWFYVERVRELPEGGAPVDLTAHAQTLSERIQIARGIGEMERSEAARAEWRRIYGTLRPGGEGVAAVLTERGAPQVLRLSMIYALLDGYAVIEPVHIRAAHELWLYCERTVRWIYGQTLGDRTADRLLEILLEAGDDGLTRTEIQAMLHNHARGHDLDRAIEMLEVRDLATRQKEPKKKGQRGRRAEKITRTQHAIAFRHPEQAQASQTGKETA